MAQQTITIYSCSRCGGEGFTAEEMTPYLGRDGQYHPNGWCKPCGDEYYAEYRGQLYNETVKNATRHRMPWTNEDLSLVLAHDGYRTTPDGRRLPRWSVPTKEAALATNRTCYAILNLRRDEVELRRQRGVL